MSEEREKLTAAIKGLELQRAAVGDAVVDAALAALRKQLSELEAPPEGDGAEDERKLVTIVFADISGFTALAEKLDPEQVRELVNACFDTLVPIVQKYEGTIDKFIGDEIMALFGAPTAHEDDAERALRAALEMMEAIGTFNHAQNTALGLHIGVNTGRVIAGKVGAQDRRDYSVTGDAVNLAARLEDASTTGEIFVGPATYRQTAATFEFELVAPLRLKGKEAPVEVHRLIGLKAAPKSTRGIEGLRAALVGRDAEFEQIQAAFVALGRREGGALAILGEAGLGKSRLLAEARAFLSAGILWAEGRALSYTAGMSYWLARAMMLSLLEVRADASSPQINAALEKSTGKNGDLYPYLARLLEMPMEPAAEERVKFLSGEALQARILEAFREYVRDRTREQPLILVWEDLHWCDPSSWRVFEALLPLTAETALLILCAARLEENAASEFLQHSATNCRVIQLAPLTRGQSSSLIEQLLRVEQLPPGVRDLILDRAEGNPFFVEELIRSLIDAGVVVLEQGRAKVLRDVEAIEIPGTVEGVLAARIDRLAPEHKQALQRASVIGRIFQQPVLHDLYERGAPALARLPASLAELQRREFIQSREQAASETAALKKDEYIFKHAITHNVAYGSMLLARRRELHQLAAQAIETLFPERLDELSATLGYHFERAQNAERAVFYLGRAAERAKAAFANQEAIAFYQSALVQVDALAGSGDVAVRLNEGLGDVLTLVGRHPEAREAFDRAHSLLPDIECVWLSRLHRKTGFSQSLQRHFTETGHAFDAADDALGEAADTAEWWEEKIQIQLERMHLFYWQGMASEMQALAKEYRPAVEARGSSIQRGKFFQMLGLSLLTGSGYRPSEECMRLFERAVFESEGSANLSETAHMRFTLGFAHLWRGNFEQAVAHCEAALELAERVGDLVIQSRCLTYLAVAYRGCGSVEQAATCAKRTLELATKVGMIEYVAMAKANLAWVAWRENSQGEAESLAHEALKLWHGMDDPYSFDWMALWPLGALAYARGNTAEAIEHLRALLDPNQHPLPETLTNLARQAIDAWEAKDGRQAHAAIGAALYEAKKQGQL